MSTTTAPIFGFEAIQRHTQDFTLPAKLDRFLFLRHGETDGNRTGTFQTPHTPLNAAGEAQAEAAAKRLAGQKIGRIVASPMARAWRTACIAATPHGLLPEPDSLIEERVYLGLAGQKVGRMDWAVDPPGCERLERFVRRTAQGLILAIEEHDVKSGDLLVVSHGGILLVLAALAGIAPGDDSLRRNAVPLVVSREAGRWRFDPV